MLRHTGRLARIETLLAMRAELPTEGLGALLDYCRRHNIKPRDPWDLDGLKALESDHGLGLLLRQARDSESSRSAERTRRDVGARSDDEVREATRQGRGPLADRL